MSSRAPSRHGANGPERSSGARNPRRGPIGALQAWLIRHCQTLLSTLGELCRRPGGSLLTGAVIGVALALPAALHVLVDNTADLAGNWEEVSRVSVFMHPGTDEADAEDLAAQLDERERVQSVEHISAEQALDEFEEMAGFGEALDVLEDNPLPPVLVVHPTEEAAGPDALRELVDELGELGGVDLVQVDTQWIERFHGMLEIAERGILVIAGLLGFAVIIVVGNTIRLEIENRREEIEITKLVGATDAFIRRPFLYTGLWYGVLGGVIAWTLVAGAVFVLHDPVRSLAGLYGSEFRLGGLDLAATGTLFGTGALLGWLGSWVAVSRHLHQIEPG